MWIQALSRLCAANDNNKRLKQHFLKSKRENTFKFRRSKKIRIKKN